MKEFYFYFQNINCIVMTEKLKLYSDFAEICSRFYDIYFNHEQIADLIYEHLREFNCKKIVFIGGLVLVAKELQKRGYEITFVDYTEEMIIEAKKRIKDVEFVTADMRSLYLPRVYDAVVCVGRVFTYMHTDEDAGKAIKNFADCLKLNGILIVDNYETGKIEMGDYFNGTIEVRDNNMRIKRISSLELISDKPTIHRWKAVYEVYQDGVKSYKDKSGLRSFTKEELKSIIEKNGFRVLRFAKNFEEKSFITVARVFH